MHECGPKVSRCAVNRVYDRVEIMPSSNDVCLAIAALVARDSEDLVYAVDRSSHIGGYGETSCERH